eukprot:2690369-Karenia_brevis.AAC.1
MIFRTLGEEDWGFAERLTWMPAHGATHTTGCALKSDGCAVTGTDWRANRLADALAKTAAGIDRVPHKLLKQVDVAAKAAEFAAARLGVVTHKCNNHK